MKTAKLWLTTIATLLCSLTASAYDFYANGICYDITSETTVSVTYKDEVYNGNGGYYYNYYTKYSGSVVIPSTVTYGSKTYSVTSIGYSAFSYCSSLTSITIPESVTSIGYSAFSGTAWYNNQPDGVVYAGKVLYEYKGTMPENTSIEVKEGTVSINSEAFYNCSNLASITIPESVTSIGNYAFSGCSSLTSITIPESVTTIGDKAFSGTAWYNNQPDGVVYAGNVLYKYKGTMPENTSIEVKEGTASISPSAFSGCSSLTSITIPESVTSIGSKAFFNCSSLTSITIPESVTSIESNAFYDCSSLTSITIPESVTSIDDYAFDGCSSLTAITIPESVTSIGSSAFDDCSSLTAVHIKDIASWCNIDFGDGYSNPLRYAKNLYLNGELVTELTIPNTVTAIKYGAFYNCSSLTSITIPESVTSIGYNAFYNCRSLTSITIQESVTSIESDAFYGTAWYNNQPDGVVYAGKVLYKYKGTMPANTSIEIKEGTVSISPSAFEGCSSLASITIPESVTSIGYYAFDGCSSLRKVVNLSNLYIRKGSSSHGYVAYYAGKVITADDAIDKYCFRTSEESTHYLIAYYGNDSILNLPEDYHGDDYIIDAEAFADDTRIVSVNIPQTVGEIGSSAFARCSKLASVTIPRGVMSIGDNAFENCSSLAAIVIPQNMLTIGSKSFAGCSSLSSVEFKEGVETIGNNAFANCTSLATVIFPESLTAIGYEAFVNCTNLTDIVIPQNMLTIGSKSFAGCSSLASVEFKEGVETIGKNAFANCTSLATLIFPESLTAIGDGAFKGCSELKTILFSENIDAYGSNVFEGCDAVETMTVKGSVMPTVPSDKITCITLYSPVPLETAEFANKVYRNATVYVPQGSLERYQAASVWKNFWTIKEFDPTGIEQLTNNNGQLTIYDLKGRKIEVEDLRELEKGVYVVNGRKVLIND